MPTYNYKVIKKAKTLTTLKSYQSFSIYVQPVVSSK